MSTFRLTDEHLSDLRTALDALAWSLVAAADQTKDTAYLEASKLARKHGDRLTMLLTAVPTDGAGEATADESTTRTGASGLDTCPAAVSSNSSRGEGTGSPQSPGALSPRGCTCGSRLVYRFGHKFTCPIAEIQDANYALRNA